MSAVVKITGKQLKALVAEDWGHPEAYWDDMGYIVDGVETEDFEYHDANDDAVIEIFAGTVYLGDKEMPATKFVRKWLKKQTHVTVLVEVPREQEQAFREHLGKFANATALKS